MVGHCQNKNILLGYLCQGHFLVKIYTQTIQKDIPNVLINGLQPCQILSPELYFNYETIQLSTKRTGTATLN